MRILFVAPRYHTNQYQMVKTLQANRHEVYFHATYLGPTEDYSLLMPQTYPQSRISVFLERVFGRTGTKRPYFFPAVRRYWQSFSKLQPQVVIIREPYICFSLLVAVYALWAGAKVVFYTQEDLYRERKRKTALKQRLTLLLFKAAWMTPMQGRKPAARKALRHMYYVPLPIPVQPASALNKKIAAPTVKILMVGKYHQERKKHLLLIQAAGKLAHKYSFKLTLVGECVSVEQQQKFAALQEAVLKLGLTNTVDLVCNVAFRSMAELYAAHHVFVLPSVNEPYSISVLEALGHGLPVICTDSCGSGLHVRNGYNGFTVKSSSLDDLVKALEYCLADRARLEQMSRQALFYAENHLSGSAYYNHFRQLLNTRFPLLCQENEQHKVLV